MCSVVGNEPEIRVWKPCEVDMPGDFEEDYRPSPANVTTNN
jgi:hypothetical protein